MNETPHPFQDDHEKGYEAGQDDSKARIAELEAEQSLHDAELDAGTARAEQAEADHYSVAKAYNERYSELIDARARIAELEAHAEHDEDNLDGLQHALVRANQQYTKAEAAIAEMEAMLAEANAKYRSAVACSQEERDRAVKAEAERDVAWELVEELDPHHLKRNKMGMRQQRRGGE